MPAPVTLLLLLALTTVPATIRAQEMPLEPGDPVRVRLVTWAAWLSGTFEAAGPDSLRIVTRSGGPRAIAWPEIRVTQAKAGRARVTGGLGGAVLGLFVGAAGGAMVNLIRGEDCSGGGMFAPDAACFVPLIGALVGLPAGAALGATVLAPTRWRRVDLSPPPAAGPPPPTVTPVPTFSRRP